MYIFIYIFTNTTVVYIYIERDLEFSLVFVQNNPVKADFECSPDLVLICRPEMSDVIHSVKLLDFFVLIATVSTFSFYMTTCSH